MITNESGQVAMVHFISNPKGITLANNMFYYFQPRKSISLCWVEPTDVNSVLAIRDPHRCCGGSKLAIFRVASQQEVNIWKGVQ